MSQEHDREMFQKALQAIANGQEHLALRLLEQVSSMDGTPSYLSSKALCSARVRGSYGEAVRLCREAIGMEPENPAHYLNLGRIFMDAGEKGKALETFNEGIRYGNKTEFGKELVRLGVRKPPVFAFLNRKHPLNKYGGMLLAATGLR